MSCRIELLERLADRLEGLPGVGRKSAERMAFYLLSLPKEEAKSFADAITDAAGKIVRCKVCGSFCETGICSICENTARQQDVICVVADMRDVFAFERTNEYRGLYHVLHGLISPMDGVGPEDIDIMGLLARVKKPGAKEVIMATGPTVEGEATAMYISRFLKQLKVKVTKLAYGIPIGASLDCADELTLATALNSRSEI